MKVAQTTTSSTDALPRRIPGASGHQPLGPRPAPPTRPLTARPLSRDLDWEHIPSAPGGSFYGIETGSHTRADVA